MIKVAPDWWKTLFDETYLITDARTVCDEGLTCREVDKIVCNKLLGISQSRDKFNRRREEVRL